MNKGNHNIIAFHGSDHKTGVTMTAQSVSSEICRFFPDLKVIMISMNNRPGCDYVKEDICGIEDIRIHINNRTLKAQEIKQMCKKSGNFYMLAGVKNIVSGRDYFPETAEYIIEMLAEAFDVIICDAGNDPDNGLVLGALHKSGQKYCVMAQCESSIREYENREWLYRKLGVKFTGVIVNKYFNKDPYNRKYIAERLYLDDGNIHLVRMAGYSRQAEMEHQTLLEYRNDAYGSDIEALAKLIMSRAGHDIKNERKKRLWKTGFI